MRHNSLSLSRPPVPTSFAPSTLAGVRSIYHPPPPPTKAAQDIKATRRLTCENYRAPTFDEYLTDWHLRRNSWITERLQIFYADRSQTVKQQRKIIHAQVCLHRRRQLSSPLEETYARIITLYDERLRYIQEVGNMRFKMECEWGSLEIEWGSTAKEPDHPRKEQTRSAFLSTITFMEHDYMARKLEFITEVYGLLVRHDAAMAGMIMDDLLELVPEANEMFVWKAMNLVVDYDGVVSCSAGLERIRW